MINFDYTLMYVTDDRIIDDSVFFSILENSLKGGASIIQLREKSLDSRSFYQRAVQSKEICDQYQIPLIINDRLDIALAIDAAGVHLGQKDLPVIKARKILGPHKIIGLSISNEQQLLEANTLNIDYVGVSPVFNTTTKTKDLDNSVGLEGLRFFNKISTKPMISIGGINKTNAAAVIKNGSNGIAVVSAISKALNPKVATEELKNIICQTGTKQ